MKKAVTIFFLFIISVQCLPVKELGKCLFDSSFVEEDTCKKVSEKKCCDELQEYLLTDHALLFCSLQPAVPAVHFNDDIHPSPVNDVFTPPPNA